ncbi:uncharacterized protein LOC110188105 [Drosophila serrata]|uniref:uncharacterized protein LOC110188105 n=1 Tax=Drosophila serrata TaxID=7274 RepID=UPI000A1D23BA|nr:uncharacterized protein LOC110188105 [Drosophila serrata]KAH8374776.1 hypothetical protein KR200_005765 [Drosophila serrata]
MADDKKTQESDELMNRIRNELTAILSQEATGDVDREMTNEILLSPNPLPIFGFSTKNKKAKKPSGAIKRLSSSGSGKSSLASSGKGSSANSSEKDFTPKKGDQKMEPNANSTSTSSFQRSEASGQYESPPKDPKFRAEFLGSQAAKSIDDDLQKMQLELKQSYELFQGIGEKFESVNFSGLNTRIRDLHLNETNNELGKVTTHELKTMFDTRFQQNRLDKLTSDAKQGFSRHPGEFGDIPELSTFFKACTQLERGLDALRQQRLRNSELEKRMCWATEIAYDRMDEIRNAMGSDPEKDI